VPAAAADALVEAFERSWAANCGQRGFDEDVADLGGAFL
jgi:hypothetical protein